MSNVPPGTYTLSARAVTFDGTTTNSDAVTVRVDAPLVAAGAVWKYGCVEEFGGEKGERDARLGPQSGAS